jgi:hypothetical protein
MPPTRKCVGILLEAQVRYEVGDLVLGPLHQQARRHALAVARVGKRGRGVFGAQRAGAGGRVLVLGRQGRAHDAALKLVVGVGVLVVLGRVGHGR